MTGSKSTRAAVAVERTRAADEDRAGRLAVGGDRDGGRRWPSASRVARKRPSRFLMTRARLAAKSPRSAGAATTRPRPTAGRVAGSDVPRHRRATIWRRRPPPRRPPRSPRCEARRSRHHPIARRARRRRRPARGRGGGWCGPGRLPARGRRCRRSRSRSAPAGLRRTRRARRGRRRSRRRRSPPRARRRRERPRRRRPAGRAVPPRGRSVRSAPGRADRRKGRPGPATPPPARRPGRNRRHRPRRRSGPAEAPKGRRRDDEEEDRGNEARDSSGHGRASRRCAGALRAGRDGRSAPGTVRRKPSVRTSGAARGRLGTATTVARVRGETIERGIG